MDLLKKQIKTLQESTINEVVEKRLKEFSAFKGKANENWFFELCFCILAANSKQKTAENIQKKLGKNLLTLKQEDLSTFIKDNKHRFHNNKAKYIIEARKNKNIKEILEGKSDTESRQWLVKNIKGIGFKEASHFLRNTGSKNLAILDRHIINIMSEHKLIEKPKILTPKNYLQIEKKFQSLAKRLNVSSAKLDLMMWYLKTGEIEK